MLTIRALSSQTEGSIIMKRTRGTPWHLDWPSKLARGQRGTQRSHDLPTRDSPWPTLVIRWLGSRASPFRHSQTPFHQCVAYLIIDVADHAPVVGFILETEIRERERERDRESSRKEEGREERAEGEARLLQSRSSEDAKGYSENRRKK